MKHSNDDQWREYKEIAGRGRAAFAANADGSGSEPAGVHGAVLLDDLHGFLARFVAYPSEHAAIAHVLWCAHAHAMDAWESTPRIAFLSPEPGSGKTRALELTETVVPRPVEAVNVTPAYLFRKVGDKDGAPTVLFDEVDTVFGPKAKDNEELRGLLNAGHRRGAVAGRCVVVGKEIMTQELPAYCAVALAGLGEIPDTILTRSVLVKMRRRAPNERVEPFRRRDHAPAGNALRDQLAAWLHPLVPRLTAARPSLPESVVDRDADVWEPLIAIADQAGGDWPQLARVAAVTLVTDAKEATPSLGVRLLADLRSVFGYAERMTTPAILECLCAIDDAPWGDMRGKPLDARGLAKRLKSYGAKPTTFRAGLTTSKGYSREALHDAWARYLPPLEVPTDRTVTSVTSATDDECRRCSGTGCPWCAP